MPQIVTIPNTRRNSRSMTEGEVEVYMRLIEECDGTDNSVTVDDSTSDSYETTYSRGEKVRNAIKKFKMTTRAIEVRSIEQDGEFIATIAFKK